MLTSILASSLLDPVFHTIGLYFLFNLCIFTPQSSPIFKCGCKIWTAFPKGTVKSLRKGKRSDPNLQMMSVVLFPPNPTGACEWWLACPVLATTLWAGVLHSEPTCLSWNYCNNKTPWGQQRRLPFLLVTLQICVQNSQPQKQKAESEFG